MPYVKEVWENAPSTASPVDADALNHMEQGIYDAHAGVALGLATSRLHHFGHSLAAGGGASGPDRDAISRLAAALKTREVMTSKGGAILHWSNAAADTSAGNGGYNTIGMQTRGVKRASAALSANVSAGATSVTTSAPLDKAWAAGDYVHIGTGTNGEMAYVLTVTGGTTLTLDRELAGGQLSGQPIFAVPHAYEAQNPMYLLWYGLNDVMASGTSSIIASAVEGVGERAFKAALRTALARVVSAEYFDGNHASTVRSSTASVAGAAGVGMGSFFRPAYTLNDVIRIDVPANFAGGDLYVYFVSHGADLQGAVHSFTLDGAAHAPTLDTRNAHYAAFWNGFVKVFRNVPAGRHVIEATTTTGGGNDYFSGWSVGAEVPPVVILPGFNRPWDYDVWPNWSYGNLRGTTTADHGAGSNSFTISQPLAPSGGNGTLKRGELITFDPGGANEETLEIAADAAGTTVTTTTASTKPHNTGQTYQGNVHDQAILQRCINWIPDVLAEGFPASCLHVDIETPLNKQERFFIQTNTVGLKDGAHFSDDGHGVVAQAILDKLTTSASVAESLAARTSVPVAPLPDPITFIGPGATAAAAAAIGTANAVTEAFPNARQRRDLRRAVETRIQLNMGGNANPGQRGRVEYSLDGGTTWRTLGKKGNWADTAIGTAAELGQVDLTATGYKDTGWFPLPAEVWSVTDVLLRYVHGNRTSGTTTPTYFFISVEFR